MNLMPDEGQWWKHCISNTKHSMYRHTYCVTAAVSVLAFTAVIFKRVSCLFVEALFTSLSYANITSHLQHMAVGTHSNTHWGQCQEVTHAPRLSGILEPLCCSFTNYSLIYEFEHSWPSGRGDVNLFVGKNGVTNGILGQLKLPLYHSVPCLPLSLPLASGILHTSAMTLIKWSAGQLSRKSFRKQQSVNKFVLLGW